MKKISLTDIIILSNDFDSMQEDIEEVISDLGYDPRDGKTKYKVLESEDEFGNVGIDLDGLLYVPTEICKIGGK